MESSLRAGEAMGEGARVQMGASESVTSAGATAPLDGLGSVAGENNHRFRFLRVVNSENINKKEQLLLLMYIFTLCVKIVLFIGYIYCII